MDNSWSTHTKVLQIVLADDHALVTEGLRNLIDQQPDMQVIATAEDGQELLALLGQPHSIDVVVLDLQMPFSGFKVLAELQQTDRTQCHGECADQNSVRVLVLTAFADGESIQKSLQLGASGFALKTESPMQTLAAIRQVAEGKLVFPRAARRWMFSQDDPPMVQGATPISPREKDVLALLAQGKSNSEMAETLTISENTVRFHLKNIYQKLHVSNRTEATAWYLNKSNLMLE